MAKQRITEDFVKHFKLLQQRTDKSPYNLRRALDRDPQLATSIEELNRLWRAVEHHRRHSKRRFIVQSHPDFSAAIREYSSRWTSAWMELLDWQDEKAGRESLSKQIERDLKALDAGDAQPTLTRETDDEWDFDPDEHSAASLVEQIADYLAFKEEDGAFFSRAKGALAWIKDTLGLDLKEAEDRFKGFPVISVPEHVSNKHGVDDPRSLFAYLTDVRLAYIIGANLAAIAMCRACTEVLMRRHYNTDDETKLTRLVKDTQKKREFQHLRAHNLVSKIDDANSLLHSTQQDIPTKERERQLIRDWVTALQDIIARAPCP